MGLRWEGVPQSRHSPIEDILPSRGHPGEGPLQLTVTSEQRALGEDGSNSQAPDCKWLYSSKPAS